MKNTPTSPSTRRPKAVSAKKDRTQKDKVNPLGAQPKMPVQMNPDAWVAYNPGGPKTNMTMMALTAKNKQTDFPVQLERYMTAKGLSQSQLAREIWGSTTDSRGHSVARNRDRISAYLAGAGLPEPDNLKKIATVLDCTPEDLMGAEAMNRPLTRNRQHSAVQFALLVDNPNLMQVQINIVLPFKKAMELGIIVEEMKASTAAETDDASE
jgi:transcriptional regulator with XRE-family HTH domain